VGQTSEEGFSDFYRAQLPRLRRFLARRINSKETREDLETAIMTIAWRRFDSVNSNDRSFGWLAGIAGGVVSNERRSDRRRLALHERVVGSRPVPNEKDLPDGVAACGALEPRVSAALAQLRPDDVEALLLHEWDDCTYEEIAMVLGVNEAAARKRVSRARQRFAAHYLALAPMGGDDDAI
jgi:RNA polymerase sigma factor (sigma-70 family)